MKNICFWGFCIVETQIPNIRIVKEFLWFEMSNSLIQVESSRKDLFITERRGYARSFLSLIPLLGPMEGHVVDSCIAQDKG